MIIRELEKEDANDFLEMLLQLDNETQNMMYEPGERPDGLHFIERLIENNRRSGSVVFLAFVEGKCAGFLSANRESLKRVRHTVYIVTGILRDYRRRGIGTALFLRLEEWAKTNHIKRFELTVMTRNQAAIDLYEKNGFEIEGIRKRSMLVNGSYIDEYYMARLL